MQHSGAMPLQNRVLPTGQIVADPNRGTLTGNRGIIHGPDRKLSTKRWTHHAWISCVLDWQGRRRDVMSGRKWTELFFLDEAVALAAGHRPCGYCRRADYAAFKMAWERAFDGPVSAKGMDRVLHPARVAPRTREQVTFQASARNLPDGAMYMLRGATYLRFGDQAFEFDPSGYSAPRLLHQGTVDVLTPKPIVEVLRAGYRPRLHPTVR